MNNPTKQDPRNLWGAFMGAITNDSGDMSLAIARALKTSAADVSGEYWRQVLVSTVKEKPDLVTECEPASFIAAVTTCAQLGLMPDARTGHAYFVPFRDSKAGGMKKVQLIVGYRGLIELALRTKQVEHVVARVVHAGDEFHYEYGLTERLSHRPDSSARKGREITHAYAIARLKDGATPIFVVVDRSEIDAIRARSKASGSGPWVTDFAAMAAKTAVRQLMRWVQMDNPIRRALDAQLEAEDLPRDAEWADVSGPATTDNVKLRLESRLNAQRAIDDMPALTQQEEPEELERPAAAAAPAPAATPDPHDDSPIGKLFVEAQQQEIDPVRRKR